MKDRETLIYNVSNKIELQVNRKKSKNTEIIYKKMNGGNISKYKHRQTGNRRLSHLVENINRNMCDI